MTHHIKYTVHKPYDIKTLVDAHNHDVNSRQDNSHGAIKVAYDYVNDDEYDDVYDDVSDDELDFEDEDMNSCIRARKFCLQVRPTCNSYSLYLKHHHNDALSTKTFTRLVSVRSKDPSAAENCHK